MEELGSSQPSQATKLIEKIKGEPPRLPRGLDWYANAVRDVPDSPPQVTNSPEQAIQRAIVKGAHVYGPMKVPVLSIVALPIQCAPNCNAEAAKKREKAEEQQAGDFSEANPSAKIVKIPYADHFVWKSDEETVVGSMNEFMRDASR